MIGTNRRVVKQITIQYLSLALLVYTSYAHGAHRESLNHYHELGASTETTKSASGADRPADSPYATLGSFKGLQLLPGLDNKWTPGAFSDLKPRMGILAQGMGPVVITNAFSEPSSQLGSTLKFAHEMVAIERTDNTILVVNSLGIPISLFDLRLSGRQTFPNRQENYASVSATGISFEFLDGTKTSFSRLPFLNSRGEKLSLFSKLTSPAGKEFSVDYTVSSTTKLATYTRIGRVSVNGSAQSGRIVFQHMDIPVLRATLTYKAGALTAMLGTADEIVRTFTLSNGLVSQTVDKFGYKSTFAFVGGRLTSECNHNGACISYTYGTSAITQKSNTENYTSTSTFDLTNGLLSKIAYAGWEQSYTYQPSRAPTGWRISSIQSSSKSGVRYTTTFDYDNRERVIKVADSNGRETTYQYSDAHPRTAFAATAITSTLAGNTVEQLQLKYTDEGLLEEYRNLLVSPTSQSGSMRFTYNSRKQVESVRYGDGSISQARYEDPNFPDVATTQLLNGRGYQVNLAPSGQPTQFASIPAALSTSIQYSGGGLPSIVATSSSLGSASKWMGNYAAGWFLGGEVFEETAQGVTAVTYKAGYKWDDKFRSIVERSKDFSTLKSGLSEDGGTIPLRSSVPAGSLAETSTTTSPIPGVAPDASGCSACACMPEYDTTTGVSVENGSERCPMVQFQGGSGK